MANIQQMRPLAFKLFTRIFFEKLVWGPTKVWFSRNCHFTTEDDEISETRFRSLRLKMSESQWRDGDQDWKGLGLNDKTKSENVLKS